MTDAEGLWSPPLNIAHRGSSAHAPENTFAAFDRAVADGADAVEMDLRTTIDGRGVVLHDRTLDRTTNGSGAVAAAPAEFVRQLDAGRWYGDEFAGYRVPELDQVVDRTLPQIPCVLHVKNSLAARDILEAVDASDRDRVTVSCSSLSVLRELAATGVYRTWISWWRDWPGWTAWIAHRARRAGVDRVAPPGSSVTPRMVATVHRSGLMLRAWGVNDDLDLAARLLDYGVDGMTFDDPARLAALIRHRREDSTP